MKLALSQIISGTLISIFATLNTIFRMPTEYTVPVDASASGFVSININPNPWFFYSTFYILLLGLIVLGVGIVQFIKARNASKASTTL
jgi:uncharacterized membrane-anchored protein